MLETLAVIAIVAAAGTFLVLRLLRPLLKKSEPERTCDLCATPCAEKNQSDIPDLSCSAGVIPSPLRQNVPGARPQASGDAPPEEKTEEKPDNGGQT